MFSLCLGQDSAVIAFYSPAENLLYESLWIYKGFKDDRSWFHLGIRFKPPEISFSWLSPVVKFLTFHVFHERCPGLQNHSKSCLSMVWVLKTHGGCMGTHFKWLWKFIIIYIISQKMSPKSEISFQITAITVSIIRSLRTRKRSLLI